MNLLLGPFYMCFCINTTSFDPFLGIGLAPDAEPPGSLRIKGDALKQVAWGSSKAYVSQSADDCVSPSSANSYGMITASDVTSSSQFHHVQNDFNPKDCFED